MCYSEQTIQILILRPNDKICLKHSLKKIGWVVPGRQNLGFFGVGGDLEKDIIYTMLV